MGVKIVSIVNVPVAASSAPSAIPPLDAEPTTLNS
jgi:hypothetical protein